MYASISGNGPFEGTPLFYVCKWLVYPEGWLAEEWREQEVRPGEAP